MKAYDSLRGINAYPIPNHTLTTIMTKRGVLPSMEVTPELLSTVEFNLCRADVLFWLSQAPKVSQGGQSYSFSEEQRERLRKEAVGLYGLYEDDVDVDAAKTKFGYKGDTL